MSELMPAEGLAYELARHDLQELIRAVDRLRAECRTQAERAPDAALDVVRAQRDCECTTHDGPHWMHMDRLWHTRNVDLLRRAAGASDPVVVLQYYQGYLQEELARLRVYRAALERSAMMEEER